ncbi:MAG: hypothetical protein P8Y67_12585, partial [Alphaproteobacteria bacterium]
MSNDTNSPNNGLHSRQANQAYDPSIDEDTNRYIVWFQDAENGLNQLQTTSGLRVISGIDDNDAQDSEGIVDLRSISAAIVKADPDRITAIKKKVGKRRAISIVVPDCRMWPNTSYIPEQLEGYLKGYRDAVVHLTDLLTKKPDGIAVPLDSWKIESLQHTYTWGLNVSKVPQSQYT